MYFYYIEYNYKKIKEMEGEILEQFPEDILFAPKQK